MALQKRSAVSFGNTLHTKYNAIAAVYIFVSSISDGLAGQNNNNYNNSNKNEKAKRSRKMTEQYWPSLPFHWQSNAQKTPYFHLRVIHRDTLNDGKKAIVAFELTADGDAFHHFLVPT